MLINIFEDFGVPYQTHGKNCREGWVNTRCPYCDDVSNHLGGHIESGSFNCWKCGRHDRAETLSKLLGIELNEVFKIIRKYKGKSKYIKKEVRRDKPTSLKYPNKIYDGLLPPQKQYLISRGYDPETVCKLWNVKSTTELSFLNAKGKRIDFRGRIIIPIEWSGQVVSYQSRDITNESELRYMSCPAALELINHKRIYYSHGSIGRAGICVEGITDVWRMGKNSFALFGIQFTNSQINVIANRFDQIFILFDNEPIAQKQANLLIERLSFRNVDCYNISDMLGKANDPAELKEKDVKRILREVGL